MGEWRGTFPGPAGRPPDPATWRHELGGGGWGDDQLQAYTDSPANAALTGAGQLAITARREPDGSITSARLTTQGRVGVTHGSISTRVQVPGTPGSWAAVWMLGSDIDRVGWPACGEIDVMEHVGIAPREVHGTAHLPGHAGVGQGLGATYDAGVDLSDGFHDYAVTWAPDSISWSVDGVEYHRLDRGQTSTWPFEGEFFLLVNLAVGGSWPGHEGVVPQLPATLLVDHVVVTSSDPS